MDRNGEEKIREVFDLVVDLSDSERQKYYEEQDVELKVREKLERLVRVDNTRAENHDDPHLRAEHSTTESLPQVAGLKIVRELGRGGMGVVYEARDIQLNQRVALKILHPETLKDEQSRLRFLREMETLASLEHSNIVRIYRGHEPEDQPYCVMELLAGGPLSARTKQTALRTSEAVNLVCSLANAVHYAHQHTVLHRDLKPDNVVFDGAGTPKLTDFGLAKRLDDDAALTRDGAILGTPAYMAPEQTRVQTTPLTTSTDVYGLGAILYYTLTGTPPFQGEVWDVIEQVRHKKPIPPRRLAPAIPRVLEQICLKCLAKDPLDRYPSADALSEDLKCWIESRPLKYHRTKLHRTIWLWVIRHRLAAAIFGLLLILLPSLGTSGLLFSLWEQERSLKLELQDAYQQLDFRQYASLLRLASNAIVEDQHGEARRLLDRCPPKFRDWEWSYLSQRCLLLKKVSGHRDAIAWLDVSHNHEFLATAGFDETVKLWRSNGEDQLTLAGHGDYVRRLAFSLDDSELAVGVDNGVIWIRSIPDGGFQRKLTGHTRPINGLCYSPDGKWLASAGMDGTIRLYNRENPTLDRVLDVGEPLNCVVYSNDGERLISGDRAGIVRVWNSSSGEQLETIQAHSSPVFGLRLSTGGDLLATGGADKLTKLWSTNPLRLVRTIGGHTSDVNDVAFSPKNDRLATASDDGTVRVRDVATGLEVQKFLGHKGSVQSVSFLNDGRLTSVGYDGAILFWKLARSELPTFVGNNKSTRVVRYSPTGSRLAVGGGNGIVRVCEAYSGNLVQEFASHEGAVTNIAFRSDEQFATIDDRQTIRLWKIGEHAPEMVISPPISATPSADVPFPRREKAREKWDIVAERRVLLEKGRSIGGIAFSHNGRLWATSVLGDKPKIWTLGKDGEFIPDMILDGHDGPVVDLSFSPDGRLIATASLDKTVKVWDAITGRERLTLSGHQDYVVRVAFSSDGKRIVSLSEDFTIRVWDASKGSEIQCLEGTSDFMGMCLSRNGRRLVSLDTHNTVIVWDIELGIDLLTIKGRPGTAAFDAAWSPEGRWIVIATDQPILATLDGGFPDTR